MAENQEQKWKGMTLKSLEAKLRSLPGVEVPEALKAKIFAKIPHSKAGPAPERRVQWRPGIWGFGIAAAAVLILALIFVPSYGPSGPSQTLIADLNDRTVRHILADQNNALVEDTNYADSNGRQ
jgi:hypothetical protein